MRNLVFREKHWFFPQTTMNYTDKCQLFIVDKQGHSICHLEDFGIASMQYRRKQTYSDYIDGIKYRAKAIALYLNFHSIKYEVADYNAAIPVKQEHATPDQVLRAFIEGDYNLEWNVKFLGPYGKPVWFITPEKKAVEWKIPGKEPRKFIRTTGRFCDVSLFPSIKTDFDPKVFPDRQHRPHQLMAVPGYTTRCNSAQVVLKCWVGNRQEYFKFSEGFRTQGKVAKITTDFEEWCIVPSQVYARKLSKPVIAKFHKFRSLYIKVAAAIHNVSLATGIPEIEIIGKLAETTQDISQAWDILVDCRDKTYLLTEHRLVKSFHEFVRNSLTRDKILVSSLQENVMSLKALQFREEYRHLVGHIADLANRDKKQDGFLYTKSRELDYLVPSPTMKQVIKLALLLSERDFTWELFSEQPGERVNPAQFIEI